MRGVLPLRQIVAALQTAGYDGDYDVELMGEDIERMCYRELLQDCRRHSPICCRPSRDRRPAATRTSLITAAELFPAESIQANQSPGPSNVEQTVRQDRRRPGRKFQQRRGAKRSGLVDQHRLRRFFVLFGRGFDQPQLPRSPSATK